MSIVFSLLMRGALIVVLALSFGAAFADYPQLDICGPSQPNTPDKTCIVDGDTLWLFGENIRLESYDTPESNRGNSKCPNGGTELEVELASEATSRFQDLLNGNAWTIERGGFDNTRSQRQLANFFIDGVDVGQILVDEGLARWYPDGPFFWCDQEDLTR